MTSSKKGGDGAKVRGRSRGHRVKVKTARGRKLSSTRWLDRQLNDPYVAEAKRLGYRSRAAFKLIEIDEKFDILRGKSAIVDLGAAPGGWLQVAHERLPHARLVGIDLLPVEPVAGAHLLELDFLDDSAPEKLKGLLEGNADLVMSDMAANTTGHKQTDHLRTMAVCETALDFAAEVLEDGGDFIAKVLQGGASQDLIRALNRQFQKVSHVKPPASRKGSVELYVVARGFRGS
ncbi:MAG: RlmE family RNA methyltransferase [Pseudomonadota bacterium]